MYQSVSLWNFQDAFQSMDRKDNFSYEGLKALFEYLEEYEDSTGEQIELDVIAICSEYTEYDSFEDFTDDHGGDYEDIDELENYTQVIRVGRYGLIVQDF